jgi:hypothetical protein
VEGQVDSSGRTGGFRLSVSLHSGGKRALFAVGAMQLGETGGQQTSARRASLTMKASCMHGPTTAEMAKADLHVSR